jgi:hypothetical protein
MDNIAVAIRVVGFLIILAGWFSDTWKLSVVGLILFAF